MSDSTGDSALDLSLLGAAIPRDLGKKHLEEEITLLFEQARPSLLRYLSTFRLPQQESEEVVQEVFLALFFHLQKNKARINLRAWLFRVAHNMALKRRTIEAAETITDVDRLPHPAMNPEQELLNNRRQQQFSAIFSALPQQDRRCLYLRAEGLRYREIAEVTGMSLGSVALSLERSLNRFQRADQR